MSMVRKPVTRMRLTFAAATEADAAEIAALRTAAGEHLTATYGCRYREVGRVRYRGVPLIYL